MNVSFTGYKEGIVTFEAESDVTAGMPVTVSGNGKVKKATNVFCGICKGVRNGYAAVQLDGYVQVPYTSTLTVGYQSLAADSTGKLKVDASNGRQILVVDIDTVNSMAGIIL